jgi:hypothetical protein
VYRLGENYQVRDWGGGREGPLEFTILIGLIRMFWVKASAPLTSRCVVCGVCVCVRERERVCVCTPIPDARTARAPGTEGVLYFSKPNQTKLN